MRQSPLAAHKTCIGGEAAARIVKRMQADDLTREQARAIKNKLQPMLCYLSRLKRRMSYRGFLHDDELMQAVVRAEAAMHELHILVHYISCGDSVGRQPNKHPNRD